MTTNFCGSPVPSLWQLRVGEKPTLQQMQCPELHQLPVAAAPEGALSPKYDMNNVMMLNIKPADTCLKSIFVLLR